MTFKFTYRIRVRKEYGTLVKIIITSLHKNDTEFFYNFVKMQTFSLNNITFYY